MVKNFEPDLTQASICDVFYIDILLLMHPFLQCGGTPDKTPGTHELVRLAIKSTWNLVLAERRKLLLVIERLREKQAY